MAERPSTENTAAPLPSIRISILGDLELRCSGVPVALPSPRVQRVLINLALQVGRPIPTDVLIDRLWGAVPPPTARKSVQKAIWELRNTLGPELDGVVVTTDHGYVLRVGPDTVDADLFESLVDAAFAVDAPEAIRMLETAEELWRGPALDGFADLDEIVSTAVRLEEQRVLASERRLGLMLGTGRWGEALVELEQLAPRHPLREELWAHLMSARAMSGRRDDALAAYQQIRRELATELGVEPSSRLRELERRILAGEVEPAGAGDTPPPARSAVAATAEGGATDSSGPAAGRLPRWLTSFVGREAIVELLSRQLDAARLVTLTGVGGSGKTRLAAHVADGIAQRGVVVPFIDLSAVETADRVRGEFASTLAVGDQTHVELAAMVAEKFRGDSVLMLVDNCEHVVDVAARVITELLDECPTLTVLATSRQPLGIVGEHVLPVPPLGRPDRGSSAVEASGSEAVEMFVERARSSDPSFRLDDGNVGAVVEICDRLDGVPLALELAAAQLPAMTVHDMADRLDHRFALLGSSQARPARHATLRSTVDWSYELLGSADRRAFERISVCPATFDIAAATAVVGGSETDALATIGRLVQRSMVYRPDHRSRRTRYRLLETLRAYGREQLAAHGGDVDCRRNHAEHFASFAERFADPRPGDGDRWTEQLDTEYPNLVAALEFGVAHEPAIAVRMVDALSCFWTSSPDRVGDGLRYVAPLLELAELTPDQRAQVACCAAELGAESGESVLARAQAEQALARFEDAGNVAGAARARLALGRALVNGGDLAAGAEAIEATRDRFAAGGSIRWGVSTMTLGFVLRTLGDYEGAARAFGQMLSWARRHGLATTTAKAEWLLGSVAHHRGDLDEARARFRRALVGYEALDDRSGIAHVRMNLGDLTRLGGDDDEALELYESAHATLAEIGDLRCIASAVKNLADLERERDPAHAAELYLECLERRDALGDRPGLPEAFEGLAAVLSAMDQAVSATVLLAQAERLRLDTGSAVLRTQEDDLAATRRRVARVLATETRDRASRRGDALDVDEALALARAATVDLTSPTA